MAALAVPHWERIPPFLHEVLVEIGLHPFSRRFYLGGGTALALQIGHRQSVDLDFFSFEDELLDTSRHEIFQALRTKFEYEEISSVMGTLQLKIQGSDVGFYSYGFSLIDDTKQAANVALAGLLDIGLMKVDAIMGRGARKDFYDLFFITQTYPLDKVLSLAKKKYPYARDYGMMALPALVEFDFADQQKSIDTSPQVSWEDIKTFFLAEVRRIGRQWFEE